ncbi:MAG TPA: bifunctional 3-deoxy-7-phosphoheptulonate synthase/chorismate mutase type II [Bacteroidales bacterium]|nr:bifunctional 3-deoxy-7-phosphoheptulonate synthase/chorismate mutase type II [Bacteroidales bacterium]HPO66286.1 bifunctional 3-deoxy-7-phosphoheptulonate synthase/chorismate mutase type II [Bacteroidales bacterium]
MEPMNLQPFTFEGISTDRPLVIAGPCSAESEAQMVQTAQQLAALGIKIFRAGIWKPRTRPGTFEGYGSLALPWMQSVKEATGMLTATEVANVKHVYEALKAGIDILWIGARTSANPFAVQEIADALRGVDVPVMVKNPVNPDLELWIGAIERLYMAGVTRLAAGHRGFSTYEKTAYRNDPNWQIPIELRRRIPNIPLIIDPSHICGKRYTLFEITQKAMDLNYDGIIIESHIDPDHALSDAKQQLRPDQLGELLKKLVIRKEYIENGSLVTIEELRSQIDKIDDKIVELLEKRMHIAEEIGKIKKENNIAVLQTKRWHQIITQRMKEAREKGLSEHFIENIFRAIHEESINHQTRIMNEN